MWNNEAKLWLNVQLSGHAQTALQHFPDETEGMYTASKEALGKSLESPSRQDWYQAEFQTQTEEDRMLAWLAEELRVLVDKVYPTIEDKGREQLVLNLYLGELENPQVVFSVDQQQPKRLEQAITTTLEMEVCLSPKAPGIVEANAMMLEENENATPLAAVATQGRMESLTEMIKHLLIQMDQIEQEVSATKVKEES